MNWQRVGRATLVAFLVCLPALTYLLLRGGTHRRQQSAVERARRQQQAWDARMIQSAAATQGFMVGRAFPRLPAEPAAAQQEVMAPGRPTAVLMVRTVMTGNNRLNLLTDLRERVERTPGMGLLVVTQEPPYVVARNARALAHPRIRYARVGGEYLERLQIFGDPVVYYLDGNGVIEDSRIFDFVTRPGDIPLRPYAPTVSSRASRGLE